MVAYDTRVRIGGRRSVHELVLAKRIVLAEPDVSLSTDADPFGLRDVAEIKERVLASPSRQDEFFGLSGTPEIPLIGGDATYKVIRDRVAVIFNCQRLTALVRIIM
ncbi:hypothetical protein CCUS01_09076 [Colletotrichum cuscutae]|uniref:Uncharacterized protein n=1 Tax=Colletotrichum cuscutae TaxID=1209917 RepID=A0AAI9UKQ1_9PEZI|nr:hypothetical protein CCUS01_09076 [Colletotrichum cuscutae]